MIQKFLNFLNDGKLLISLFCLLNSTPLLADGSRNLYPAGTLGGRAFLYSNSYSGSNGVTLASWPFKSRGTHYAYLKAGEILHTASSAQGIGNGRIVMTAPDGSIYTSGNNTTGQISSRTAENAGPRFLSQAAGSNRYITFNRTASLNQAGIWKIEFLPTGDINSSSTPTVTNIAADSNWTQPTDSELIAAWDVAVESSGSWIQGRVYSTVFNLHLSSSQTAGFNGQVYALTKDGYIYRVNNNGNNGVGFTFFVNNRGFITNNESTYKSINYSSGISSSVHSPLLADTSQDITHKIFYATPATDMPANANGSVPGNNTWLRNNVITPNVLNVNLVGAETTPSQVSTLKGGYVKFNAAVQGAYTITIESASNPATFVTRVLTGIASAGDNSVFWNGKDGNGNNLPEGNQPIRLKVQLRGAEVHFPFIDMEINPNGMILELLNGADTSIERYRVYWDDTDITRTATNNQGKASTPANASISGSLSGPSGTGGHMWGQQNNNSSPLSSTNLASGFANEKSIDTWSYIKGPEAQSQTSIVVKTADLQVTSITADKNSLSIAEQITYTVKVRNNGPSSAENAPFRFLVPAGFDSVSISFSGNSCGSQSTPVTYDPVNHVYVSKIDIPAGCEITYIFTMLVTSAANAGNIQVEASILRPNDVTDPDATNTTPGVPPTDAHYECTNNGSGGNCNNILTYSNVTFTPVEICTEPVDGNAFQWSIENSSSPVVTQNITQPSSNYGFVFDIYELDNSFNLNINGTLIAAQELQFQSSGTSGINVRFADGSQYETDTTHNGTRADIWQMRGNAANPLIRISISPSGVISLFGSKASYGPLQPLVLMNGNTLNSISWNHTSTNNITVTQNVVGLTIMNGYGYGLNITQCACYRPAMLTGTGLDTKMGITLLQRAGSQTADNWPMGRKSGHLALESNTKGFVITRMSTVEIQGQMTPLVIAPKITSPQEGMMIYDTTARCLKIYHDAVWSCFNKQACP
ncbi:hypothetical protein PQ459_14185 [Chryseobacterium sp. KACC 21268]|nr:hypothetical protein PQ459_14185 [Chryseobacterium sp. KACC 21268]